MSTKKTFRLRPIDESDSSFLRKLYATTREDEMSLTGWSQAEQKQFLDMQFRAQHAHYQEHFKEARFDLIELDDRPIGRLYVDRRPGQMRIIDIALMPEYRGHGLGSQLMRELLQEAASEAQTVCIHVEQYNPARRFYQRLGFTEVRDKGVYIYMECAPKEQKED